MDLRHASMEVIGSCPPITGSDARSSIERWFPHSRSRPARNVPPWVIGDLVGETRVAELDDRVTVDERAAQLACHDPSHGRLARAHQTEENDVDAAVGMGRPV
jgi:hypothetical protein